MASVSWWWCNYCRNSKLFNSTLRTRQDLDLRRGFRVPPITFSTKQVRSPRAQGSCLPGILILISRLSSGYLEPQDFLFNRPKHWPKTCWTSSIQFSCGCRCAHPFDSMPIAWWRCVWADAGTTPCLADPCGWGSVWKEGQGYKPHDWGEGLCPQGPPARFWHETQRDLRNLNLNLAFWIVMKVYLSR